MDIPVFLRIDNPDTYQDFLCGQSNINAAVVRDAENGQIKEHIEIISKETQKNQGAELADGIAAVGVVVLAVGGVVYLASRVIKRCQLSKAIKKANKLREAFQTYIQKATEGCMDVETIDTLLHAFEKVKGNDEIVRLAFDADQIYALLNLLATYTRQMSEAYKVEGNIGHPQQGAIILDFNKYLQKQRDILCQAA